MLSLREQGNQGQPMSFNLDATLWVLRNLQSASMPLNLMLCLNLPVLGQSPSTSVGHVFKLHPFERCRSLDGTSRDYRL